ncbi:MAG: YqaJ viral recombinase family protein [Bacteroidales bacterium]
MKWRRQGIGASDAPVIMGVSPFKTTNQLWKEKILGENQKDNSAMARGRALEPEALDYFMSQTGIFLDSQKCIEHPERNWMRATMDGLNEEEKILVEIKCPHTCHTAIPEHYYPQLQHQMEVIGYDKMFYVSFDGSEGNIIEVEKDEEYVKNLIEKEEEFWNFIKQGCKDMEEDEEWKAHCQRLKEVRSTLKELKEEESFLISQFVLFADGVPATGHGVTLQRKTRKGAVDYKKALSGIDIDLESYRKPNTQYWSVDVKKNLEKNIG